MAHGWLRNLGKELVKVESAGTQPKSAHPLAVQMMAEVGIDLSSHTSDHVDRCLGNYFDLVLTICDAARENCPVFPGARRQPHPSFEDPGKPALVDEELLPVFRRIRDEIGEHCRGLLATEFGDGNGIG